jgi:hypothetical protein
MSKRWARLTGLIAAVILVSLGCIIADRAEMKAQNSGPRFQLIDVEKQSRYNDRTEVHHFEVWHDQQSGQEFICGFPVTNLASAEKITCWPTGRNWK